MQTYSLTTAQALVRFLNQQYIEFEGKEEKLFKGFSPFSVMEMCWD